MTGPIALTCGDPSGIGPEIALKAWQQLKGDALRFFLIADADYMAMLAQQSEARINRVDSVDAVTAAFASGLPVLHHPFAETPISGQDHLVNAPATITAIEMAVELVKTGAASAVTTNPINKKVLKDGAGFQFPGHTEFLAHLGEVEQSYMMLTAPELRVVPVTIHIALESVKQTLSSELIQATIRATHTALRRDFGIPAPRIAVAGVNPHAGEGGEMGREEIEIIIPALDTLRQSGLDISGPMPADTMFHPAARAKYDAAVCMYHDQALIPIKTLNFAMGVNTTLGLPFIRTSPDHGTAFDIAGRGVADPTSLIEALKTAAKMAQNRARFDAQN